MHYLLPKNNIYLFDSQMQILYFIYNVHLILIESADWWYAVLPGWESEGGEATTPVLY